MKYQVVYIPKIEDEVVLSEYEYEIHLEQILLQKNQMFRNTFGTMLNKDNLWWIQNQMFSNQQNFII